MENNNSYNEDGYIHIASRKECKKYPDRDDDGRYIIESRKKSIEITNGNKKNSDEGFTCLPNSIVKKNEDFKKDRKKKKLKTSKQISKIPFHPKSKIDKKIRHRFDKIKKHRFVLNDAGYADIFITLYDEYVKYNVDIDMWFWWTGKYWKIDDEFVIYTFIEKMMYELYQNQKDNETKDELRYCGNNTAIRNIMQAARGRCTCRSKEFDSHKNLLNVKNGIVDLKTKELLKHKPQYMLTCFINIGYNPDAVGERFEDFILEICNMDKNQAEYTQVSYGYAITGETSEQFAIFERGNGSNGKSTLNIVTSIVVEDYTETVDFKLFQKRQNTSANAPTPELAKLDRKRLVFCSETNGAEINEAKLKEYTGGTRITARALHKNPFNYIPQFKFIFDGNNLPKIKGADYGIWRRIRVIPFDCTFEKDTTLENKLLAEKEVILKWLIEGAYKYYNKGFPKCKAVERATRQYHENEDTVGNFAKYALYEKEGNECASKELYLSYRKYCDNSGEIPLSIKDFKQAMVMKGYANKRKNSGVVWRNISIREDVLL